MKGLGWKIPLIIIGVIVIMAGLSLAFGWFDIYKMKTIGKEKENVRREIFENTQSYVEGKRQEALKYYQEYQKCETEEDKNAVETMVSMGFANFDEDLLDPPLSTFIYNCKYN